MKSIHVTFEDGEMEKLKETKGEQSWHDFILQLVRLKK